MLVQTFSILLAATTVLAAPRHHKWPRFTVPQQHFEVLSMRSQEPVYPSAVLEVTCIDRNEHIVFHDQNVAELAICGGLSGDDDTACQGTQSTTEGQYASARFTLKPLLDGASIDISKTEWEHCVRAAREKCPTGSLRAVCDGGATFGDLEFRLDNSLAGGEL